MRRKNKFRFNWVLNNKLAIGPCPSDMADFLKIKNNGIKSIISLCSIEESNDKNIKVDFFDRKRFILPDHKTGKDPTIKQIVNVLENLEKQLWLDLYLFIV